MLDAIPLKSFRASVVHVHRQRDRDRALRVHQPLAIVLVDAEIIRDDLKLIAGHFKYYVVVNRHERERNRSIRGKRQMLFALKNPRVKSYPAQDRQSPANP